MPLSLPDLPPLVVVTGKGGVGKTMVSCALARSRARAGTRVLLLELDGRESLHRFLGCPPSGGEITEVADNLDVQNVSPRRVVDSLIAERVRPAWVARRVLASTIYEQFVQGAPGLREAAALGYARRASSIGAGSGAGYDLVILDAPASGHGVSLLEAPRLLSRAIGSGPVAELAREVATMVAQPDSCGLWAVTTAEGMAIRETLELDEALAAGLGRSLDLLLVNRLLPERGANGTEEPAWLAAWTRRAAVQAEHEARLRASWDRSLVRLPLSAAAGPAALDELEMALEAGGAGAAGEFGEAG